MKTLLCTIARMENKYIREFVEHYKKLGYTNICLFDNNYDNEDNFHDVIEDYINDGFVILKDYRNKIKCQLDAYNECYDTYKDEYDWISFFDVDEFLVLNKHKTIDEYLSQKKFNKFGVVCLNWLCYGDNGLVNSDETMPVQIRFREPVSPIDFKRFKFPENDHVKCCVRGGLNINWKDNPHVPSTLNIRHCNNIGTDCNPNTPTIKFNHKDAYLKHYSTKTVNEYAEKIKRGFADSQMHKEPNYVSFMIELFFKTNKLSNEKIDVFNKVLGLSMPLNGEKRDDAQIFLLAYNKPEYGLLENRLVTPIQCGASVNPVDVCPLKDNIGDNISHFNWFFVENTGLYWIWKNMKDLRFKGQMQYRRRFEIDENINFDEIFDEYDIICAEPYKCKENIKWIPGETVEKGYGYSHNIEDLYALERVIKKYHPQYSESYDKYIKEGDELLYSSGFILPAHQYNKYCEFLFTVLKEYINELKIKDLNSLIMHVMHNAYAGKYIRYSEKYENIKPNNLTYDHIMYQTRIGGYIAERIFTMYAKHHFKKFKYLPYVKMENNMYI